MLVNVKGLAAQTPHTDDDLNPSAALCTAAPDDWPGGEVAMRKQDTSRR